MVNYAFLLIQKGFTSDSQDFILEKAAFWLRYAINEDESISDAYYYLGILHQKGIGADYNIKKAYDLFLKAASLDHAKSMVCCADILYSQSKDNPSYLEEALSFYVKAAERKEIDSILKLGQIYEKGLYFSQPNIEEAEKWYLKGRDMGSAEACLKLALLHSNSRNALTKSHISEKYFIEAADKGNSEAQMYVSKMMMLKLGSYNNLISENSNITKSIKKDEKPNVKSNINNEAKEAVNEDESLSIADNDNSPSKTMRMELVEDPVLKIENI